MKNVTSKIFFEYQTWRSLFTNIFKLVTSSFEACRRWHQREKQMPSALIYFFFFFSTNCVSLIVDVVWVGYKCWIIPTCEFVRFGVASNRIIFLTHWRVFQRFSYAASYADAGQFERLQWLSLRSMRSSLIKLRDWLKHNFQDNSWHGWQNIMSAVGIMHMHSVIDMVNKNHPR